VGGFHHLDALRKASRARRRMVVTGNHQARQGCVHGPKRFQGMGHGASSFARTQHQGAPTRHIRQTSWHIQQGLGTCNRCVKELAQKLGWILVE
jgi:hypothetical protein